MSISSFVILGLAVYLPCHFSSTYASLISVVSSSFSDFCSLQSCKQTSLLSVLGNVNRRRCFLMMDRITVFKKKIFLWCKQLLAAAHKFLMIGMATATHRITGAHFILSFLTSYMHLYLQYDPVIIRVNDLFIISVKYLSCLAHCKIDHKLQAFLSILFYSSVAISKRECTPQDNGSGLVSDDNTKSSVSESQQQDEEAEDKNAVGPEMCFSPVTDTNAKDTSSICIK